MTLPNGSRGAGNIEITITADVPYYGPYVPQYKSDGTSDTSHPATIDVASQLTAVDLAVTAASVTPSAGALGNTVVLGDTVSASWTVTNQNSTDTAVGPWIDAAYLSSQQTLDSSAIRLTDWVPGQSPLRLRAITRSPATSPFPAT